MIQRILLRLGYPVIDLDAVARSLAAPVLRDFEPETLEPVSTVQYLRTRYMRLVADYGLPAEACNSVADKAWRIIAGANNIPVTNTGLTALYD